MSKVKGLYIRSIVHYEDGKVKLVRQGYITDYWPCGTGFTLYEGKIGTFNSYVDCHYDYWQII